MTDTLLSGLDSGWSVADPAALAPEHAARLVELEQLDPALAALYARGAQVLAGAADARALAERHTALLGRERGVVTRALAEMPSLTVEQRKVRGKGLNLVKKWLTELHDARRDAIAAEEPVGAPALRSIIEDVFAAVPLHLEEQLAEIEPLPRQKLGGVHQ